MPDQLQYCEPDATVLKAEGPPPAAAVLPPSPQQRGADAQQPGWGLRRLLGSATSKWLRRSKLSSRRRLQTTDDGLEEAPLFWVKDAAGPTGVLQ